VRCSEVIQKTRRWTEACTMNDMKFASLFGNLFASLWGSPRVRENYHKRQNSFQPHCPSWCILLVLLDSFPWILGLTILSNTNPTIFPSSFESGSEIIDVIDDGSLPASLVRSVSWCKPWKILFLDRLWSKRINWPHHKWFLLQVLERFLDHMIQIECF